MRIVVTNYTFIPASNQIVFNNYTSIAQENILLILDATTNQVLYNPTSSGYGGTVAGNVLTLAQSTVSLSATDKIQIFYEDIVASNSVTQVGIVEKILKRLGALSFTASASGAGLNTAIVNTPAVTISGTPAVTLASTTLAAGVAGIGGVTLGTTFSQAGQSQLESFIGFQSSFRRNITPL